MNSPPQSERNSLNSQETPSFKFYFNPKESKIVSYVSLFDNYCRENSISDSSSDESEESHSYPVFMQNLFERLEKYGTLAQTHKIGQHRPKKPKNTDILESDPFKLQHEILIEESESSEESGESLSLAGINNNLYDLDDDFIDDENLCDIGIENELDF